MLVNCDSYHGNKKMVESEKQLNQDGQVWQLTRNVIFHFHPPLLGQDLEHAHEDLLVLNCTLNSNILENCEIQF